MGEQLISNFTLTVTKTELRRLIGERLNDEYFSYCSDYRVTDLIINDAVGTAEIYMEPPPKKEEESDG